MKDDALSNYNSTDISAYQFLLVVSKNDATHLSDKPRLRNDPILYLRRSRAAVSRRRDLILRAAHCHSSRAISSFVPERTTSNSRVSGIYRNGRCLGPNVAEENGDGVRLKRRGKRESSRIVGVYRFLFSVAVETFKGQLPFPLLSETEGRGVPEKERWRGNGGSEKERNILVDGKVTLRSRQWSLVVYPSVERTRCLFVPPCVSQHTHYRPQRGAN